MPSLLAQDPAPAIASLLAHDKRASFDRHSQTADRIEGSQQGHLVEKHNGVLPNGSAIFPLPNGQAAETGSLTSRESLALSHQPGDKSRRSSTVEPDKGHGRRGDSRLAPKDDGYFATAKVAQIETGFLETHVKLGAVNGNPQQESKGEDEPSIPQEDRILHDGSIYTEPGKLSPGDKPAESSADGSLRMLHQANRISSPSVLQRETSTPLTHHPSNRIQQRHNLEVPRSTNRLSRESPNRGDVAEVITASGRVTPSTPTRRRGSMTLVRRATRSLHSDMHLDDVPQDEDAARWTEMVRQKRMSKRKRKEEEEEDTVVMGTKVDQNHVNYVTAYNMLTGIRFTVSRTNAKVDRDLTDADFEARHKFSFDV
jgi:1-phosphatidylinositol-4-phosphate 5-kinase